MKKIILAMGVLSVFIYSLYYQKVYDYYSVVIYSYDINNPLYLWGDIANCTIYVMTAMGFFYLGRDEDKKIRVLGFNAVGFFWILIISTYLFNYIFDQQIQMHRVLIAFVGMFIISIISLISSWIISFFKSLLAR